MESSAADAAIVWIAVLSASVTICDSESLLTLPGIGMLSDTLEPEALSDIWLPSSSSSPIDHIISCFLAMLESAKKNKKISKGYSVSHITAAGKVLFSSEKCWYLSYFSKTTYVVGTH